MPDITENDLKNMREDIQKEYNEKLKAIEEKNIKEQESLKSEFTQKLDLMSKELEKMDNKNKEEKKVVKDFKNYGYRTK